MAPKFCTVEDCTRGPFNDQQALNDHLRSFHNIGPKTECIECGKQYQRASSAYVHIRSKHPELNPLTNVRPR